MSIVSIYVEKNVGSGEYVSLDLIEDENIFLNFKYKDSKDVAKAFSTYSQSFTIPASSNNIISLNYEFSTTALFNRPDYINAKIYINSTLFKTGFVKILQAKFKEGQLTTFQLDFFTSITSMKDILGEKTLADIETQFRVSWTNSVVGGLIQTSADSDIMVPLISVNRLLEYDGTSSTRSDIKFVNGSTKFPRALIKDELRPAIRLESILDIILFENDLLVDCPLRLRSEFNKLFIWCTKDMSIATRNEFPLIYDFEPLTGTPTDPYYYISGDTETNIISIGASGLIDDGSYFQFSFNPYRGIGVSGDVDITLKCVKTSGEIIATSSDTISSDNETVSISFPLNDKGITIFNNLDFKIIITSSKDIFWENADLFLVGNAIVGGYLQRSIDNFYGANILLTLPTMKQIDFISSIFKMFNLSVVEDTVSRKMKWLTPGEFFIGGTEINYTDYGDVEDVNVKKQDKFGKYLFQHKDPSYSSSVEFKKANIFNPNEKEFGQLIYDTQNPFLKNEYKLETSFSILVPRMIEGTNIETAYGFDDSAPTLKSANGLSYYEYTPVTDAATIFYSNGPRSTTTDFEFENPITHFKFYLPAELGIYRQSEDLTYIINKYQEVKLIDGTSSTYNNSIAFQSEIEQDPTRYITNLDGTKQAWEYEKTLFTNYYFNTIQNLVDNRTFLYTWKVILPTYEMIRFSLQNTIVIGNNRYKVEEAQLNLINGACTMTLSNIL